MGLSRPRHGKAARPRGTRTSPTRRPPRVRPCQSGGSASISTYRQFIVKPDECRAPMPAGADLPRLTDPSKVAIGKFTSPEAFLASQCSLGTRVIDAPAPDFRGKMTRIDLDRTRVRVGEATHRYRLSPQSPTAGPSSWQHARRRRASERSCGAGQPDLQPRPNDLLIGSSPSGKPWPWTTITVGYATFEHDSTALAARTVDPSPIDAATVRVPDRARHRLLGLVANAARLATTRPEIAEVPAAACALSGAILEALVECLAQGELQSTAPRCGGITASCTASSRCCATASRT